MFEVVTVQYFPNKPRRPGQVLESQETNADAIICIPLCHVDLHNNTRVDRQNPFSSLTKFKFKNLNLNSRPSFRFVG